MITFKPDLTINVPSLHHYHVWEGGPIGKIRELIY